MLRAVAHPVAMNPTNELLTMVSEDPDLSDKVKVVVERKDMVYELTPDCIHKDSDCKQVL